MKRTLFLIVALIFIATALAVSGCGQVNEPPAGNNGSENPKSVAEQREELPEENTGDVSEEKIIEESNASILAELAELEASWSQELHQLVIASDDLTDQWIYGDMVYNSYIIELFKIKQNFDQFYESCDRVYTEKGFAEKLKDEPKYAKGLAYGVQMRETVRTFFDTTYGTGKESAGGEIMDISGEEFEQFYIDKMVTEYNDSYRKLTAALASFK